MLDSANLLEILFVEHRLARNLIEIRGKQRKAAVIPDHFRMHARVAGGVK